MMHRIVPSAVWVYALFFALLTSLPYLVGVINTPTAAGYSGTLPVPGGFQVDYNSHIAKMWQGARGQWDYQLLFTHEPHPGLPGVQIFYVALGAAANLIGLSFPTMYQLARFVGALLIVPLLWRFAGHFLGQPRDQWAAVFFGTLLMGVGWLMFLLLPELTQQVAPIEFWLSDAYHFTGALYMPHFSAAICLQMVALLAFLSWLQQRRMSTLIIVSLALAADALIQPYVVLLTFPLFAGVITGNWFLQWRARTIITLQDMGLLIPAALHGGIAFWQYSMITGHPVWKNFSDQNITHSPEPIYYVFGYLPLIVPIIIGIYFYFRPRRSRINPTATMPNVNPLQIKWLIPVLWIVLVVVLLYVPTAIQRRYLLGVQTPLAILAAWGWAVMLKPMPVTRWRFFTVVYLAIGAITPLLIIFSNTIALAKPTLPVFYTADELAGYAWLRANAASTEIVLTVMATDGTGSGGRLVAMTGQRVFMGHWIETVYFKDKQGQLTTFFAPQTTTEWRQIFLDSTGIRYLWYDDYARTFGTWSPTDAPNLELVFQTETVQIYQVMAS